MSNYLKQILFLVFLLNGIKIYAQIDSLVSFDPYDLTKTSIVVYYDTNSHVEVLPSYIGSFENKIDPFIFTPDTSQNRFSNNIKASENFDMLSFPVSANVALLHPRYTKDHKASGSGILISPNAVLTAGHIIGYEANHSVYGKYFKWNDSIVISPSHQDGNPQPAIGTVKVKKCYIFKSFVNSYGHNAREDIALLILDKPIGYDIGWIGLGYVSSSSFLLDNVFYNFSYPAMDGYDGFDMYFKLGKFSNVSYDMTSAYDGITAIPGESGSGFFYADNSNYSVYGIRTYSTSYTLLTEHKFRIFEKLLEQNQVPPENEINSQHQVIVYPNPASDFLFVRQMSPLIRLFRLSITNLQGQLLYNENEFVNGSNINISNYKSGIYIIEITSDNYRTTKKLIIK